MAEWARCAATTTSYGRPNRCARRVEHDGLCWQHLPPSKERRSLPPGDIVTRLRQSGQTRADTFKGAEARRGRMMLEADSEIVRLRQLLEAKEASPTSDSGGLPNDD